MKKRMAGLLLVVVVGSIPATVGTAAADTVGTARVWVLQGLPGATVDVCIDGVGLRSDLLFGQNFFADLSAEQHVFHVRTADPGDCTGRLRPTLALSKPLVVDANYTIVAGAGDDLPQWWPKMFFFRNNVNNTPRGIARLTVRDTASAGTLDVWDMVRSSPTTL